MKRCIVFVSALLCAIVFVYGEQVMKKKEKHYGTWPSPIKAELISQSVKRFGAIEIEEGKIYWEEMRPQEGGRTVIVSEEGDVIPAGFSACTRVHEYGGKSFTVHKGTVYFVNDKDQRIYVKTKEGIDALTKEGLRFADLCLIPHGTPHGLIAVCEAHEETGVENFLVLIDCATGDFQTLVSGDDFYSSPSLSHDGKKLAWLSWNLPNMPWDGTRLWTADFTSGKLQNIQCVAGSDSESLFEPQWGPDGYLYFVSDKSGWWNLYRLNQESIEPLCAKEAEFGLPQWVFGMSTYGFIDHEIVCTYFDRGSSTLALLDPETKQLTPLSLEGTHFTQVRSRGKTAAFLKGSPTLSTCVVKFDMPTRTETIVASNKQVDIDPAYFSIAQPIAYPSAHGRTAYGFYYPPTNKEFTGFNQELPPLIVKIHGGPTAQVTGTFNLGIQFWTSRGFAVLDVNYGGSTGYGKEYRNSLNGQWGVVDVEDSEYGAQHLIDKGCVDPNKVAITGGSAGGYTTLAALTFGKLFHVGASYFGVSDPALLAKETHKFESRYLDRLIGPYPERIDLYKERSPMDHVDTLSRPVIFFQGLEDKVVPPDQAEILFNALKERNIYTKLVVYPEERHGFRKAETIVDSLNKELEFYLEVFYDKQ